MKPLRLLICIGIILTATLISAPASAQLTYTQASEKADRFFGYQEWGSASALYNYMLKEKPEVAQTYGKAIVCNAMLNDSVQSMHLMKQAMAYNIPIDSVLSQVKKYSFEIGKGKLFEDFMLQTARENPWLSRPIDHQLLKYYTFRNDGPMMVKYSTIMLNGAPNDARFLSTLAKGYMLVAEPQLAVETWQRIITLYPDDYHTLLCLANYYASEAKDAEALHYFQRAYALRPTPYVAACIQQLM